MGARQSMQWTARAELELVQAINEPIGADQCFYFMRSNEAYKSPWGAEARSLTEVRIVAPWLAARMRLVAWHTSKLVGRLKRALKKHVNGRRTRKISIRYKHST